PIQKWSWSVRQVVDCQTRPLSSAAWALAPPNSLRYQNFRQPVLSNPIHHASQPQMRYGEEDWEDSLSVCVLVRQGESHGLHTLLEIPVFGHNKMGRPLTSPEFLFPLTTVDGSREDDINVVTFKRSDTDAVTREHGCFRSLFETEGCPAPFMSGSTFYCFHCPGTHTNSVLKYSQDSGLDRKTVELPSVSLCSHAGRAEGEHRESDREGEEKLALMYERLRIELPRFFMTNHDYSMYSNDVEFIN
ncbi:uncharacterized protein C6orf136 homolog, partial [Neolamprologus brichardi]|uniref:uncharacterized protein C6orf136 homolog n=1 Tax=Neolamprologus brichardi TaxID=32507 RepID=UPI0003EC2196